MIPKRAMFYWSGAPLSWMRFNTLWSFRKLHPDWEMILFRGESWRPDVPECWQEKQDFGRGDLSQDFMPIVSRLGVDIRAWFTPSGYAGATPVHFNDLCRWGALAKFGGWFFDMDFLFVDKLDGLADEVQAADATGLFLPARDWIPTGFVAAETGSKFAAEMYLAAINSPDKERYRAAGSETIARVLGLTGGPWMRHSTSELKLRLRTVFPDVRWSFPSFQVAYPWEWFDTNLIFSADEPLKLNSTVAIHWYGGSRIAQRFIGTLDEKNFRSAPQNTYTHFVRDLADAEIFA